MRIAGQLVLLLMLSCSLVGGGSVDDPDLNNLPSGTQGPGGVCDNSTDLSKCINYSGSDYKASSIKQNCTGTYGASACSSDSCVSLCTVGGGQVNEAKHYFYSTGSSPYTADTAKAACVDLSGVYSRSCN